MPPQRKHEQPLARQIQCLRGLKLETTEADRGGGVGGVRQRRQSNGRAGTAVGRHRNGQNRQRGHRRDSDLYLGAALIAGGVLLQAGILVDRIVATAFVIRARKGHGWRSRRLDAGLCNADRLGE